MKCTCWRPEFRVSLPFCNSSKYIACILGHDITQNKATIHTIRKEEIPSTGKGTSGSNKVTLSPFWCPLVHQYGDDKLKKNENDMTI